MQDAKFRSDYPRLRVYKNEKRSDARLQEHYILETGLARRLKDATAAERATVYGEVYTALFQGLADHPQITKTDESRLRHIDQLIGLIRGFLSKDATVMEVGCGDARMSFRLADRVKQAIGVDVTNALVNFSAAPANFRFVKTDGIAIELPDQSVDFVYSDQLIEHLHPDDAPAQLREIFRVLKSGGSYWVATPSRVTGPHDISQYFDFAATGFHLKEYSYSDLRRLLRANGFAKVSFYLVKSGHAFRVPTSLLLLLEAAALALPPVMRARVVNNRIGSALFGLFAVGTKA